MRRPFRFVCPLVLLLSTASTTAQAQTLYAITDSGQLLTISTATGAGTIVGNLPAGSYIGLGFRGSQLYVAEQIANVVQEVNPSTAAMILPPFPVGFAFKGEGDITFRSDGTGFLSATNKPPLPGPPSQLYTFQIPGPSPVQILPGPVGQPLDGLAFDNSGNFYALAQGGSPLYTVSLITGGAVGIGAGTGIPVGYTRAGLAFDSSGKLFAAVSNAVVSQLYTVDPVSGVATVVGPISFSTVAGLSFQPPPPPPPPPVPVPAPAPGPAVGPSATTTEGSLALTLPAILTPLAIVAEANGEGGFGFGAHTDSHAVRQLGRLDGPYQLGPDQAAVYHRSSQQSPPQVAVGAEHILPAILALLAVLVLVASVLRS